MRIAIAAIGTESCTFSPLLTRLEDFDIARGAAMLELGLYPFLAQFEAEFVPTMRARALPGGSIEPGAYRQLKGELLERLRAVGPVDGLYLDLHGAMHMQGMDDAEGDLVMAMRKVVGPDCLISVSLDLHGNVSERLVDTVDILTAFRTAPHVDVLETREKACAMLVRCLREGLRPQRAWVPIPVVLPGEKTSTEWEPGASVYGFLSEVDAVPGVLDASLLVGYVWADEPRASATTVVTGFDEAIIRREAARIALRYWDARQQFGFGVRVGSIDECIGWALAAPERGVFVSDSGDNPTAGGAGDVPVFLERLLALRVPDAVYASIPDDAAIAVCREVGVGAEVSLSLGGKLDPVHGTPLPVSGRVISFMPGNERARGGDQAVIQVGGAQVIVTQRRKPFHTIADFQRLGIEPLDHQIVVVKIGYLEPDLKRAASLALLALSPGAVDQAIERLPFKRIRRPVYPLDPDMTWQPPF